MGNTVMRLKYTSLLLSLLTAWTIFLSAPAARAGVYTYGASQRTVNAGVLLNGAYAAARNDDPYPFYILSQRPDVRPYGWNLVNPLAPKSASSDISTKWGYTLGQPVLPGMAAYWEVRLNDVTAADLAQYDVLLLNLSQANEQFTAADAEKLRRYVDGGGVLWIEQSRAGGTTDPTGPLFSPLGNLTFTNSGGTIALNGAPARPPILTTPYALSEQEIVTLGYNQNGQWSHTGGSPLLQPILTAGGSSLSVGTLGAGTVVASSTQCANAINNYANGAAGNSGAFCGLNYAAAPSGDLKLLCNIIASSGAGPHEHQNAHQQGGSANSLTAAVLSWTYPLMGTAAGTATSPVINGNIAYVVDAGGVLHAFDTNPAEDLDSDGNPDDGVPDFSQGKPYDELWQVTGLGDFVSAPTVAFDPGTGGGGKMAVFVETKDGKVHEYNASVSGPGTGTTLTLPAAANAPGSSPTSYSAATGPAPAPTVYEGRVYAGQPTASLYVYDLITGSDANFVVNIDATQNSAASLAEFVTAPPSVGIQTESQRGADTNDIVAYVTTNHGLYTVFCGARGEALSPVPLVTPTGYNTKLQTLKPTGNAYGRIDNNVGRKPRTYTLSGGLPVAAGLTLNGTPPTDFNGSAGLSVFADYDVDFAATLVAVAASGTDTGPLTRTGYSISSQTRTQAMDAKGFVSAPALDRNGNAYFTTVDATAALSSSLLCVHDSATPSSSTIAWRFRLPGTGDPANYLTDADNTNYGPLAGFHFVGSPVVDGQGNVYALASNTAGDSAAVLCFNGLGPVTLDVFGAGLSQGIASATYTQPLPTAPDQNEFGEPLAPLGPQQYTDRDSSGHLTLTNFGSLTGMNGRELSPNLSEPQPVTVQYTPSTGGGGTAGSTLTSTIVPLHTNLNWFVVTNAQGATGLTLAGNRLYFGDSTGGITKVIADPQAEGVTLTSKVITDTAKSTDGTAMVSGPTPANVGAVGGALSSADGLLMVNGLKGVSCFADRTTLVVEAGRVMEVDADGQATWVVDSTTRATTEGGDVQVQNGGPAPATPPTGQTVTTDINLSHPSSVTQLTRNDYLVADSGNNRAVRFDRSGHVIWELTKFNDPNNYLTAGEADTLNQPTSVQIFREQSKVAPTTDTLVHYLVADSGNNRVLEVTDKFDKNFTLIGNHELTWISRTGDKQGRAYRYASASYYAAASGKKYVAALVTNARIADLPSPFTAGTLSPANRDAPGGSLALLDYVPTGTVAGQKNGYIGQVVSKFTAKLTAAGGFDINATLKNTGTASTLFIRNPRYLKPFTSPTTGGGTEQRFLLADDNGVFDLDSNLTAQWGFTEADYQNMQTPVVGSTVPFIRIKTPTTPAVPFVPSCIQRIGTDTVNSKTVGRYLVTNAYAQGEASNDLSKIGGEAFELRVVYNTAANLFQTDEANVDLNPLTNAPTSLFTGHTISRPGNTSPLEQPTFAYRLQ